MTEPREIIEIIDKPDMKYTLHIKSDKKVEHRLLDYLLQSVVDVFEDTGISAEVKPSIDVEKLIQARLRGIQKTKLDALQSSDLNTAYMMKGAENVCNEILTDIDAITGN